MTTLSTFKGLPIVTLEIQRDGVDAVAFISYGKMLHIVSL